MTSADVRTGRTGNSSALRGLTEDDVSTLLGEAQRSEDALEDDEASSDVAAGSEVFLGPAEAREAWPADAIETLKRWAIGWLEAPGATRRGLAAEAIVRVPDVTALLKGRGATLPTEALERVRAVVRPRG